MTNKIVRTIHAHASETVEIVWHREDADVHVLRERHQAPTKVVWDARTKPQDLIEGEWNACGNSVLGL